MSTVTNYGQTFSTLRREDLQPITDVQFLRKKMHFLFLKAMNTNGSMRSETSEDFYSLLANANGSRLNNKFFRKHLYSQNEVITALDNLSSLEEDSLGLALSIGSQGVTDWTFNAYKIHALLENDKESSADKHDFFMWKSTQALIKLYKFNKLYTPDMRDAIELKSFSKVAS